MVCAVSAVGMEVVQAMNVPGTYVDAHKSFHDVRVVGLSCADCLVEDGSESLPAGSELSMFIGAIGPIHARAEQRSGDRRRIRFVSPIDRQIVEHFAAA